jgi:hypothetical protein
LLVVSLPLYLFSVKGSLQSFCLASSDPSISRTSEL